MDLVRKRFLSMLLPDEGVVTGGTTCSGSLCAWTSGVSSPRCGWPWSTIGGMGGTGKASEGGGDDVDVPLVPSLR
uniref:Uncharacterized protein n=1 Tax=Oryza glumipatula TaxID=40148 RepID=A0A0E0BK54_9ORYZ